MKRTAIAVWKGSGKEGKGYVNTESKALDQARFTFSSRFENETATNPEELIAAAHAMCFSMKLSFVLNEAGFTADSLETTAYVTYKNGSITESQLVLKASIPGINPQQFGACVKEAEISCPVSKVLNATIGVEATLVDKDMLKDY